MKKNLFTVILFSLFVSSIFSQDLNKIIFDQRAGKNILIDYCNRSGLGLIDFGRAYTAGYDNYNTESATISELKPLLKDVTIQMVLGTWCYDSKLQVPKFMKMLDETQFADSNLTIVAVNRMKKTNNANIDDLKINYVPTFIVYRNKKEIGRIVEKPKKTLEQDLLKIVK
ncbi:MAG: thioredoxin family protein [Bacteroidetes bacterium]|nr:thioredoxin family protein [Bacteroidota bacterium]